MRAWQGWAPALADDRLTCQLSFETRGSKDANGAPQEVHAEGLYLGRPDEFIEAARALLRRRAAT